MNDASKNLPSRIHPSAMQGLPTPIAVGYRTSGAAKPADTITLGFLWRNPAMVEGCFSLGFAAGWSGRRACFRDFSAHLQSYGVAANQRAA